MQMFVCHKTCYTTTIFLNEGCVSMFNNKSLSLYVFFIFSCILILTACDASDKKPNSSKEDSMVNNESNEQIVDEIALPEAPLQKWDKEDGVKSLLQLLNQLNYDLDLSDTFNEQMTWAITDIQLQIEDMSATGIYDENTKEFIQAALNNEVSVTPGDGLALPSDAYLSQRDSETVENPYDVLALINKEHALPEDYIPEDLIIPNVRYPFTDDLPKKQLRKIAANALEKLFEASDHAGLDLYAQSGYRSYDRQVAIFAANVEQHGEKGANNFSARPGQSEHQSGLTMDVTTSSVEFKLVTAFGETPEGIWLTEHAHEYGFIIRYLKGSEHITQYQYEPWHLRYIGEKVATEIYEQNLTFEEYIEQK